MSELIRIDADMLKSLLVPERLDLIIKYLYIDSYMNKNNIYFELYQRHIALRTGGIEDHKRSIKDYVRDFNNLIEDMRENEFDKRYPIPVSRHNGIILDGAHRLACCLYFNKPAFIEYRDNYGVSWDSKWLYENGFQDSLQAIYRKYTQLKSENTFMAILWGPIENHWDDVEKMIAQSHTVIGRKDFSFNHSVFSFLVEEIYSYEFGVKASPRIKDKIKFLLNFPRSFSLILFDVQDPEYLIGQDNLICNQVFELKKRIRENMQSVVDERTFATIHTSDHPEHTNHLSNILLSRGNFEILSQKKISEPRQEFLNWLEEFIKVIKVHGLSKEECCIVGSSSLEVLDIRNSTDIDFILCEKKRKELFPETFVQLSPTVDIASKGYHEHSRQEITFSDDQIIFDNDKHFYFRGLKFASLAIIRDRKAYERRPKDIKDVMLIDDFIKVKLKERKNSLAKKLLNRLVIGYRVQIIALSYKFKRHIWNLLSTKQREFIKKHLIKRTVQ